MIKKTAVSNPQPRWCHKHGQEVEPFYSVKQDKWFWLHQVKDPITGKFSACFVNSEEEDDGFKDKQRDYAFDAKCFNDDIPRDEVDKDIPII